VLNFTFVPKVTRGECLFTTIRSRVRVRRRGNTLRSKVTECVARVRRPQSIHGHITCPTNTQHSLSCSPVTPRPTRGPALALRMCSLVVQTHTSNDPHKSSVVRLQCSFMYHRCTGASELAHTYRAPPAQTVLTQVCTQSGRVNVVCECSCQL